MPAPNLIWGGCARKEERVSHAVQQASWGNQALLYLLFSLGSGVSLIIILQHTPALPSHVQGFLSPFFSNFKLEGRGIAGPWTPHLWGIEVLLPLERRVAGFFCGSLMTIMACVSRAHPLKWCLGAFIVPCRARHFFLHSCWCCFTEQTLPAASPLGFPSSSPLFPRHLCCQFCCFEASVYSATCPVLPGCSCPSPLSSQQHLAADLPPGLGCDPG